MSGSSGGYGRTPQRRSPCDQVDFETTVASPDSQVASGLSVGDQCTVELHQDEVTSSIGVFTPDRDVLGAIVDRVATLLHCLQEGHEFSAEVLSKAGGRVQVRVRFES